MTGKRNNNDAAWTGEGKTFKLVIDHLALLVRRPIVSEKFFTHHSRMLKQGPAIYPYTKTMVNWTQINKNVSTFFTNELFPGRNALPTKLYTVFQVQDRTLGTYTKNSFKFERPDHLESIGFYIDNKYVTNFMDNSCTNMDTGLKEFLYTQLFMCSQQYYGTAPNTITMGQFMESFFVVATDCSPAQFQTTESLPLLQSGSLRLKLVFKQNTEHVYNVITFGLLPGVIKINDNKQVSVADYF